MSEGTGCYRREILFSTDFFEVVAIEWASESAIQPASQAMSPRHNHGWSQCLVLVQEGTFEDQLDLGMKKEIRILVKGEVLSTPIGARHEMKCKSQTGKTLHVYTPKIKELTEFNQFNSALEGRFKSDLALVGATDIDTLRNLLSHFKDLSVSTHSPYFMNQLFSGVLPQMLIAEEFIAQTKTTLATYEASPVLSAMESEVVSTLCEKIGWPTDPRCGISVPGGSAANFMAIHCARQKLLPQSKTKGAGEKVLKVFVSAEAHYSFKKACAVLGIGTDNMVGVAVDSRGRMDPQDLEAQILQCREQGALPLLVAATAGSTVLGAFDDIQSLSAICRKYELWLHVDGAWGGPVIFSQKHRHLVKGIELADSFTFDAHKLIGASLTSSYFLTQHTDILLESNDVSGGDYLFHSSNEATLDRGRLSWQCGRKGEAASFWTIWKSLGTEGIGQFVDRLVDLRDECMQWIQSQDRLQIVSQPEYLNLCVRVLPPNKKHDPNWSQHVREALKQKNLAFVNYSANSDGTFLRLILANPYLTFDHVKQILQWAIEVD